MSFARHYSPWHESGWRRDSLPAHREGLQWPHPRCVRVPPPSLRARSSRW
ncbi:hypothetical protein [Lysobacter gummosus]